MHCSPVDRVWSCVLVLLSPPPDLLSPQLANSLMRFETFGCWSHIVPLEACVDRPTVRTTRMIRTKRFSVGPSCVLRKRSRRLHSEFPSPSSKDPVLRESKKAPPSFWLGYLTEHLSQHSVAQATMPRMPMRSMDVYLHKQRRFTGARRGWDVQLYSLE